MLELIQTICLVIIAANHIVETSLYRRLKGRLAQKRQAISFKAKTALNKLRLKFKK